MLPSTSHDLYYNNAKVRRQSHLKVMTRSMFTHRMKWNCGSCGIGGILALSLVAGFFYLAILHSSTPAKSLVSLESFKKERLLTEAIDPKASIQEKPRKPPRLPPRLKFFGGESSLETLTNGTNDANKKHKSSDDIPWTKRQVKVAEAFRHAWYGYKTFAMGYDELLPVSRAGTDGLGGLGATIVDALDTAMIMGLDDVVAEAGFWVEKELPVRLRTQGQVNLFETTIRVMGGLLSAYHLSGGGNNGSATLLKGMAGPRPEVYLERAKDLADRLLPAFTSSPTVIPYSDVVLNSRTAHPAGMDGGASSTSEVTTLQLEFGYLSQISGDLKYGAVAMHVMEHVKNLSRMDGLVPIYISPHSGEFQGRNIRLGSRGDSYYEYLLKVWLQQGGATSVESPIGYLHDMYSEAMEGVKLRLVQKSKPKGLTFVGELPDGSEGSFSAKMDHLVCFLAGNLALGATRGLTKVEAMDKGLMNDHDKENFQLAEDLAKTCYEMYLVTATGLASEIVYFNTEGTFSEDLSGGKSDAEFKEDIVIHPTDRHNLLRPETVESLFILYRITEDAKYREWGWNIFQAFEAHTKVDSGGYSSLNDVTVVPAPKRDKMETFFLGETLKYLYLLFGDSYVLSLDKYVFNTEAHPFPIASVSASQAKLI